MFTKFLPSRSFVEQEGIKIIEYAEENENPAVGRKHDVGESCIKDWRKIKLSLQQIIVNAEFFADGSRNPRIEIVFCCRVNYKKQFGIALTIEMCISSPC